MSARPKSSTISGPRLLFWIVVLFLQVHTLFAIDDTNLISEIQTTRDAQNTDSRYSFPSSLIQQVEQEVLIRDHSLRQLLEKNKAEGFSIQNLYHFLPTAEQEIDTSNIQNLGSRIQEFQNQYDDYLILRMFAAVEYAKNSIEAKWREKKSMLPPFAKTVIQQKLRELDTDYKRNWIPHFECLGKRAKERDPKAPQIPLKERVYSQDRIIRASITISKMMDHPPQKLTSYLRKASQFGVWPLKCLTLGVACTFAAPIWLGSQIAQGIAAPQDKDTGSKLLPKAMMGGLRKIQRTPLKIEGEENLMRSPLDRKHVVLYLPPHRDDFGDPAYFAALKIPNPTFFGNAAVVGRVYDRGLLGRGLAHSLCIWDGFIPVGNITDLIGQRKTIDHVKNALARRGEERFHSFSQGFSVKSEMLPTHPDLDTKLLKVIQTAKHSQSIVPITFIEEKEFLQREAQVKSSFTQTADIIVHKPFPSKFIEEVLTAPEGTFPPNFIGLLLRQTWIEHHPWELSLAEIQNRLNKIFTGSYIEEEDKEVDDTSNPSTRSLHSRYGSSDPLLENQ